MPGTSAHPSSQAPAATPTGGPLVFFDGDCGLCNTSVQWIVKHDARGTLRFAPLNSDVARHSLAAASATGPLPDSIVLLDGSNVFTRSDAVMQIAAHLRPPWSWLRWGRVVPLFLRDAVYRFIASHRIRWFGRQEHCTIPSPEFRARFLDLEPMGVSNESLPPHRRGGDAVGGG